MSMIVNLGVQLSVQKHYQGPMDCHQNPTPDSHIGQKVFVNADHIHTTRSYKKLLW